MRSTSKEALIDHDGESSRLTKLERLRKRWSVLSTRHPGVYQGSGGLPAQLLGTCTSNLNIFFLFFPPALKSPGDFRHVPNATVFSKDVPLSTSMKILQKGIIGSVQK